MVRAIAMFAAITLPALNSGRVAGRAVDTPRLDAKAHEQTQPGDVYALVRLTPGRPRLLETMTPAEREIVEQHFEYLLALRDRDIVVHAGRTTDPTRLWGIVVMRASEPEARRLMSEDPAIRAGIHVSEVFPYSIAIDRK